MARLELVPGVFVDLVRLARHVGAGPGEPLPLRIANLVDALEVLEHTPEMGRRARGGKRELVVGRGASGYLVLYRYVAPLDMVVVLAIRARRERGYERHRRSAQTPTR